MQLQSYDLTRITEMWWDSSHYWSVNCHQCHPYLQEGQQEDPRSYRPVSLTSMPKIVTDQILLEVSKHAKDKKVIRGSQYEFMK